jgi:hypothetical protein
MLIKLPNGELNYEGNRPFRVTGSVPIKLRIRAEEIRVDNPVGPSYPVSALLRDITQAIGGTVVGREEINPEVVY